MNRTKLALFVAALAIVLLPAHSPAAERAYAKIEGSKQGVFKGEAVRVAGRDYIPVIQFDYEIISPRDAASGLPTGKRQHKPIVITKTLDASSPQIFQAMINNETLTTVTIEFVTSNTEGKELVYYTIVLTNASIADVHQHMRLPEAVPAGSPTVLTEPMEDVAFSFQKITVTSTVGQTTSVDSWSNAAQ